MVEFLPPGPLMSPNSVLARLISRGAWLYLSERAGVLKVATPQSPDRRDYGGTPDGRRRFRRRTPGDRPRAGRHPPAVGTGQDAKTALLTEDLRRVVRSLPTDLSGVRDKGPPAEVCRAHFAAELVAITLGDLSLSNAGVVITVRRSKTRPHSR